MSVDLDAYVDEGRAYLRGSLSHADVAAARDEFARLEADGPPPGYQAEFDVSDGERRLRKLRRLLWNEPSLWSGILHRSRFPEIAQSILGDHATVVFHAAFLKPARIGTAVALHQDQALWRHAYPGAFSFWCALTPVHPGNGGLHGCVGSHRAGLIPHEDREEYPWHPSLAPRSHGLPEVEEFVLEPGDVVLWDRYLVHGSAANESGDDRMGMVVVAADGAAPDFEATDAFPVSDLAVGL